MRRFIPLSALVALVLVPGPVQAHPAKHHNYRTRAGDLRWGHKQHMKALARIEARQDRQEATTSGWVIPWPIVKCESGGANLPPNGAGASGYYQIIPGTWISNGGGRWASQAYLAPRYAQDIVAHTILVSAGIGQWDCSRLVRW